MARRKERRSIIRYRRTPRVVVRRVARAVAAGAKAERHRLIALASAFGCGALQKRGVRLPVLGGLSPAATLGLSSYLLHKAGVGGEYSAHAATGLLSVASYELGQRT